MPSLTQKAVVLVGKESTYGTPPTFTGDLAILVIDPVVETEFKEHRVNRHRSNLSPGTTRPKSGLASFSFDIPVTGMASGSPPRWTVLLEGCGMSRSTNTFTPTSGDSISSLSFNIYLDGIRHRMRGCVGTFSLSADAGGTATLSFSFTGLHVTPDTVGGPTPSYEWLTAPIVEESNLTLTGLDQFSTPETLRVGKISLEMGNKIRGVTSAGSSSHRRVRIVGREVIATIDPEMDNKLDYWSSIETVDQLSFSTRIGKNSGSRLLITAPFSQITKVGYSDRDNLRVTDVELAFRRGPSGNDEFSVVFD